MQLDLRVASEHGYADDHRLERAVRRLGEELDVVRAHERSAHLVRVADEAHDELVCRLVVELAWRPDLLEPATVHDRDLVGDLHRLLLVVRHEDGRDVDDVVEAGEPLAQLGADACVERAERLVEEEHLWLRRERAGEAHALPLAAGELGRVALPEALELDEMQELLDALADLRLRPLPHLEPERDVVAHGHVLERRVVLEDEADAALLRREPGRVVPGDEDLPGVGRLEPRDDPEQRRLARAARPEQRRQRSARNGERHVVDRGEVAEVLGDVANLDRHLRRLLRPDHGHCHQYEYRHEASTIEIAYAPARSNAS